MIYRILLKDDVISAFPREQLGNLSFLIKKIQSNAVLTSREEMWWDSLFSLLKNDEKREGLFKELNEHKDEILKKNEISPEDFTYLLNLFSSGEKGDSIRRRLFAMKQGETESEKEEKYGKLFSEEYLPLFRRISYRCTELATKDGEFDQKIYDKLMSVYLSRALNYIGTSKKKGEEYSEYWDENYYKDEVSRFVSAFGTLIKVYVNKGMALIDDRSQPSPGDLFKVMMDVMGWANNRAILNDLKRYLNESSMSLVRLTDKIKSFKEKFEDPSNHLTMETIHPKDSNRGNPSRQRFIDPEIIVKQAQSLKNEMLGHKFFRDAWNEIEKIKIEFSIDELEREGRIAADKLGLGNLTGQDFKIFGENMTPKEILMTKSKLDKSFASVIHDVIQGALMIMRGKYAQKREEPNSIQRQSGETSLAKSLIEEGKERFTKGIENISNFAIYFCNIMNKEYDLEKYEQKLGGPGLEAVEKMREAVGKMFGNVVARATDFIHSSVAIGENEVKSILNKILLISNKELIGTKLYSFLKTAEAYVKKGISQDQRSSLANQNMSIIGTDEDANFISELMKGENEGIAWGQEPSDVLNNNEQDPAVATSLIGAIRRLYDAMYTVIKSYIWSTYPNGKEIINNVESKELEDFENASADNLSRLFESEDGTKDSIRKVGSRHRVIRNNI